MGDLGRTAVRDDDDRDPDDADDGDARLRAPSVSRADVTDRTRPDPCTAAEPRAGSGPRADPHA